MSTSGILMPSCGYLLPYDDKILIESFYTTILMHRYIVLLFLKTFLEFLLVSKDNNPPFYDQSSKFNNSQKAEKSSNVAKINNKKAHSDESISEQQSNNKSNYNVNKKNAKSHSNRVPYFALIFFLSVFSFTILFILLPFFDITEISIFGIVILPHDLYFNFLNAIITTTDVTDFYNNNSLAFITLIGIIIIIVLVLYKFVSSFKEPQSEFDQKQTNGAVSYFNFTKLQSRVRLTLIKPNNDNNSKGYVKDFTGTFYNYSTDAKTNNGVYCVPDKRNNKRKIFIKSRKFDT